jgi:hypothetical protein
MAATKIFAANLISILYAEEVATRIIMSKRIAPPSVIIAIFESLFLFRAAGTLKNAMFKSEYRML